MLKQRKPLRAKKPMNRGKGFKRKLYEDQRPADVRQGVADLYEREVIFKGLKRAAGLHKGTYATSTKVQPQPKENAIEHEGYRRLIAAMPCIRCGIQGYTQVCHTDFGKGMGLKTDDRGCWPGCGPHPEGFGINPGCHYYVGTSGILSREARRALEAEYAEQTRQTIIATGQWPASLPLLEATPTGEQA